jgi:subtilisin family serine protease
VNPWGIYDRRSEYPLGGYTENPLNLFNLLVAVAVLQDIDVVFAAGNCGQFCPDNRCGERDRGPAHSIWGANSLEPVLTVGAVRADDMWLGYSSQGPGQPRLALGAEKPDLCAASQFCEDDDAFSINSGTSAACGLAGGVVAALRSRWDTSSVPPRRLKQILNQTARRPVGVPWSRSLRERLGHGVLDAKAVFDELAGLYP